MTQYQQWDADPSAGPPATAGPDMLPPGAVPQGMVPPGAFQSGAAQPGPVHPGVAQPGAAQAAAVYPGAAQPPVYQPPYQQPAQPYPQPYYGQAAGAGQPVPAPQAAVPPRPVAPPTWGSPVPQPARQPADPPVSGRSVVAWLIAAVLTLIVIPGAILWGGWRGMNESINDFMSGQTFVPGQSAVARLDAGEHALWGVSTPLAQCSVSDPSGADVPIDTSVSSSLSADALFRYGVFTAPHNGDYRIMCAAGATGDVGMVGPPDPVFDATEALLLSFGVASLIGVGGIVVTVFAVIRFRKYNRQPRGYPSYN